MNMTGADVCDVCPPRFYCVNQDRADPCPTGNYCPGNNGHNYSPCLAGTYNPTTGLSAQAECLDCTGGFYCDIPGLDSPTAECLPGYYCTLGVDTGSPNDVNNTGTGGE